MLTTTPTGPTTHTDAYWRTTEGHQLRRKDYSDVYQTFGFEWSEGVRCAAVIALGKATDDMQE